jgi:hypothetical protein
VEWLEVQAIRSGLAARDQVWIDRIFSKRTAAAQGTDKDIYVAIQEIAADFEGLEDVSTLSARASALGRDKKVREALKKERAEEEREGREITEITTIEQRLANPMERMAAMEELRERWRRLRQIANGASDTAERRLARRASAGLVMSANERTHDSAYRKMLDDYRMDRANH